MGNDGGSIPTRRELVKNAARNPNTSELKATQQEAQTHHWTYCPLSNRPLAEPIISDCAGTLYNKDAMLEHLLPKDEDDSTAMVKGKEDVFSGFVKGLRDLVEVKFTVVKEGKEEKRICPITSKELGPNTKSVYLVPCGHAFSEVAIREVAGEVCVECNEGYKSDDVITILPLAEEDIARLATRAVKLKEMGLTHSLRKAPGTKKRKMNRPNPYEEVRLDEKRRTAGSADVISGKGKNREVENGTSGPSRSGTSTPVSSGIKNAATASLTAKVLAEQEVRNKRRKIMERPNENLQSLFSNTGYSAQAQKGGDFMTRGYSLPKKA